MTSLLGENQRVNHILNNPIKNTIVYNKILVNDRSAQTTLATPPLIFSSLLGLSRSDPNLYTSRA